MRVILDTDGVLHISVNLAAMEQEDVTKVVGENNETMYEAICKSNIIKNMRMGYHHSNKRLIL